MPDDKKLAVISIEDLAGLSAPLTKLIEVVAAGVGNAYRPIGIVLEGKAQANQIRTLAAAHGDAIKTIAAAQADAGREADKLERERQVARLEYDVADIRKRAELRAIAENISQQENLERIAASAAQAMPNSVSDEPVNPDWRTLFFNHARDVSDEMMRDVWGQVLAGEVAMPGSYSMRTLDVLRLMSRSEAETFARFCELVFEPDYVFNLSRGLGQFGLSFNDILVLQGAGVVREFEISKYFPKEGAKTPANCLLVTHEVGLQLVLQTFVRMPVYMMTRSGRELRRLVASKPNAAYVQAVKEELTRPLVTVKPFPIDRDGELIRAGGNVYRLDDL